ncbi:uncharacterized protein [Amphiura filiformis]|uniref:uncharacterized protein n=1 Tax=Amphiura filiformis TaxID=82378 RepID=UPI003B21E19C
MPCGPLVSEPHAHMRTMADTPPIFGRGQSQRLLTGFLEHILDNRASKRFAVLERALDSDEVYLKLYRDPNESVLRKTYVFTKGNFVGTERGSVKRNSKYPVLYWAIILTTETVLFQDARNAHSSSDFERWNDLMKELWRHQSWMVKPVYGISQSNEKEFVLHLNKVSLGLAHVNPPRHFLRWDIEEVQKATSKGKNFMFTVVSSGGNSGYYEVMTEKERQSSRIEDAFYMQTFEIPQMAEFPPCDEVQRYTEDPIVAAAATSPSKPVQSPTSSTASTTSSIDPTTGEDIHMNVQDLHGTQPLAAAVPLKVPDHLPLQQETAPKKKNTTPPSPSSSQGSPVTNKPRKRFMGPKLLTGQRRTTTPEIPSRTTSRTSSCVIGETTPPVTKTFSQSTGNLRDPSPTYFSHRLSGYSSGSNSPDIPISAKQLPLPHPPVPCFPGGRNSPHVKHAKPPSIDENSIYTGSNSSLASQSPTPSSSPMSLSDEETKYQSNGSSNQGSPKEHTRSTSDAGVNYLRAPYLRSVSVPIESDTKCKPPSLSGHTLPNMPHYINVQNVTMGPDDPVYINVSKRDDVYENPPMFHDGYNPLNTLPPIPPKGAKPDVPPWHQRRPASLQDQHPPATEVSDILNVILNSNRQVKGSDMGMTYSTFQKLCFSMDVENISGQPNNWKGLAINIGIDTNADIQMIDSFSTRHRHSPTDIILYYWHCQTNPIRPHCMEELKAILEELEREDILDILSSQQT